MITATHIRDSDWCFGCAGGAYVMGVVDRARSYLASHRRHG